MTNHKLASFFEKIQSRSNLASYIVIIAMMVCTSITFIQIAYWFTAGMTGFQWSYIPFLAAVVSIEAIFTHSISRELEVREKILYRLAEWITIAVLLKVVYYLVRGFEGFLIDLPLWQENFITFFQGEYFSVLIYLAAVWLVSHVSTNEMEALNVDPEDTHWDIGKLMNTRSSVRQTLVSRFLWIGVILVIVVTVVRSSILAAPASMSTQAPVINIMAYFALALVLFSQTQFAILRGRWFWHQTPISKILTGAWIRYSLIFFAILAIVSFLLPTRYTMGPLETFNAFLGQLLYLLIAIAQLLLLPFIWLLSLVGCTRQSPSEVTTNPASPPVLPPPVSQNTPLPWLELLQSVAFWALLIGVVGLALVQFVRQNPQILAFIKKMRIFHWLFSLWHWIKNWAVGAGSKVSDVLDQIRIRIIANRDKPTFRNAKNWANFRQLTPRQKIIFYYLRLLDRGGKHGIRRKFYETPSQYANTLESQLPEVKEDISGLTVTFIEARYSLHPISIEKSNIVQRFWRNITRSLDRLRKSTSDPKKT